MFHVLSKFHSLVLLSAILHNGMKIIVIRVALCSVNIVKSHSLMSLVFVSPSLIVDIRHRLTFSTHIICIQTCVIFLV